MANGESFNFRCGAAEGRPGLHFPLCSTLPTDLKNRQDDIMPWSDSQGPATLSTSFKPGRDRPEKKRRRKFPLHEGGKEKEAAHRIAIFYIISLNIPYEDLYNNDLSCWFCSRMAEQSVRPDQKKESEHH